MKSGVEHSMVPQSVLTQLCTTFATYLIVFVMLSTTSTRVLGQAEVNDYSRVGQAALGTTLVSDYQCIGINPANLGFQPEGVDYVESSPEGLGVSRLLRRFSVSVGEIGAAVNSNAMGSGDLLSAIFAINDQTFSAADKREASLRFANKGVYINADAVLFGCSYQSEKYGGIAFSVRERVAAQFLLNPFAADFAFLGRKMSYFDSSYVLSWNPSDTVGVSRQPKLYSQLFDSTRISMSWTREYNLAYGRQIMNSRDTKMFVGLNIRYIQGFALLNSYVDEDKNLTAYSSITPLFNINYGKSVTPSRIIGTGLIPVGSGYGFDFGLSWIIKNKWRIGFSVLDLGRIYWKGNVYTAQDYILNGVSSAGFDSYNIFKEAQKITGDGGYFKWSGLRETSTALPTRVRVGMTYTYGILRDAGIDIILPINTIDPANNSSIFVSLGANHGINPWLHVQGGMTFGGSMGFNMPAGVLFSVFGGFWEMGLSTRDVLTIIFNKNPTISLAVATCRLRF